MRLLYALALLLAISGCATIPESNQPRRRWGDPYQPTAAAPVDTAFVALQARADSLMALPPDSLTAAQLQWLQVYASERDRRDVQQTRASARRSMSSATSLAFAGLVISMVFSAILLADV